MRRTDGPASRLIGRFRDTWWLPYATGAAVSAVVLAVMVWHVVVRGPFVALDWRVHELLSPHVPDGLGKMALDTLARPGQRWLTLPFLLATAVYVGWRQRRARPLIAAMAGLASAYIVGKSIKDALARTPPYRDIDILHGVGEAFPSGHAANAAMTWALIVALLFGTRGRRPHRGRRAIGIAVSVLLAVLVGTIMVVMDYHWLSDIAGGWMVGIFALMVALLVLGPPVTSSAENDGARDRGDTLAAPGEAEPVGRGSAD